MSRKNIIYVVSLILVVGLATDVIVAVDPLTETSQKIIGVICNDAGVDHQKFCQETLQSVTGLESVDLKAYIATIVKGTTNSIIRAMNMSDRVMAKHSDAGLKDGLNCCKEQLDMGLDNLNLCLDVVQNKTIQEVVNQSPNIRSWLSGVGSYLEVITTDCFETERDFELKFYARMNDKTLNNAKQFVSMSLNIAAGLSQIVEQLKSLALSKMNPEPTASEKVLRHFIACARVLISAFT